MKATEVLKTQHNEVKQLFQLLKKTSDEYERGELLDDIAEHLEVHMAIEEDIFYPALNDAKVSKIHDLIPLASEEHRIIRLLLQEIPRIDPGDIRFDAKMAVLENFLDHHVTEEEHELFAAAAKLGECRLEELGAQMQATENGCDDEIESTPTH